MIKIELGGFPFKVPQRWDEVPYKKAYALYEKDSFNIVDVVTTLIDAPDRKHLSYTAGVVLSVFELMAFVLEVPSLVEDTIEIPDIRKDWSYKQYELCRQAISKHKEHPSLCFARITEILEQPKEKYVEVGSKAMDMMVNYINSWGDYMTSEKPTEKELNAGIERLQVFGTYSILEHYASKYGKFPSEAEKESAHAVLVDWIKSQELGKFVNNYQELSRQK